MTVRWKFTDVRTGTPYTFEINPNEGGSPGISKTVATNNPLGPNRRTIFSEGRLQIAPLSFSGELLTQTHFEAMEEWALKRTLLQLEDDLARKFQGALSEWSPQRVRRGSNPWYHTYSASFAVTAMKTSAGTVRYGYFQALGA